MIILGIYAFIVTSVAVALFFGSLTAHDRQLDLTARLSAAQQSLDVAKQQIKINQDAYKTFYLASRAQEESCKRDFEKAYRAYDLSLAEAKHLLKVNQDAYKTLRRVYDRLASKKKTGKKAFNQ